MNLTVPSIGPSKDSRWSRIAPEVYPGPSTGVRGEASDRLAAALSRVEPYAQ
jgi:hypothetical protein